MAVRLASDKEQLEVIKPDPFKCGGCLPHCEICKPWAGRRCLHNLQIKVGIKGIDEIKDGVHTMLAPCMLRIGHEGPHITCSSERHPLYIEDN